MSRYNEILMGIVSCVAAQSFSKQTLWHREECVFSCEQYKQVTVIRRFYRWVVYWAKPEVFKCACPNGRADDSSFIWIRVQCSITERQNYVVHKMATLSHLPGLASDKTRELVESSSCGLNNRSLRVVENVRKKGETNPFQSALNYLSNGK